MVVSVHLFSCDSLVLLNRHGIYLHQKFLPLFEIIKGGVFFRRQIFIAVVIDKHLSQSAMIDDVYLAFGEVEQGQSSVSQAFNVIPLYFCCEIGEKTVCQLIAYQFFTPAVFHYSRQDLLAEVYYLGPKLWHLVSLTFIKALFISACITVDLHHHLILLLPLICLLIFGM